MKSVLRKGASKASIAASLGHATSFPTKFAFSLHVIRVENLSVASDAKSSSKLLRLKSKRNNDPSGEKWFTVDYERRGDVLSTTAHPLSDTGSLEVNETIKFAHTLFKAHEEDDAPFQEKLAKIAVRTAHGPHKEKGFKPVTVAKIHINLAQYAKIPSGCCNLKLNLIEGKGTMTIKLESTFMSSGRGKSKSTMGSEYSAMTSGTGGLMNSDEADEDDGRIDVDDPIFDHNNNSNNAQDYGDQYLDEENQVLPGNNGPRSSSNYTAMRYVNSTSKSPRSYDMARDPSSNNSSSFDNKLSRSAAMSSVAKKQKQVADSETLIEINFIEKENERLTQRLIDNISQINALKYEINNVAKKKKENRGEESPYRFPGMSNLDWNVVSKIEELEELNDSLENRVMDLEAEVAAADLEVDLAKGYGPNHDDIETLERRRAELAMTISDMRRQLQREPKPSEIEAELRQAELGLELANAEKNMVPSSLGSFLLGLVGFFVAVYYRPPIILVLHII